MGYSLVKRHLPRCGGVWVPWTEDKNSEAFQELPKLMNHVLPPGGAGSMPRGIVCCEQTSSSQVTYTQPLSMQFSFIWSILCRLVLHVCSCKAYSCKPAAKDLHWETSNSKTETGWNLHRYFCLIRDLIIAFFIWLQEWHVSVKTSN